jgi:mono/diheme cytochrome c family protein
MPDVPTQAGQAFALARSVSPAGRVFVPHARIHTAALLPNGYGSGGMGPTENFVVAVLDEDTGTPIDGTVEALAGVSCVLPRAAVSTNDGELLVACLGTNEVVAMDAAAANPGQAVTQRFRVPAGPVGIAVDDSRPRALVWSAHDRALTWILLRGEDGFVLAWEKLPARSPLPAQIDRGRRLFHISDARISADGRACASCHPDGRDDGLVWSTPEGPRNPPMLAGRVQGTEPYGWLGGARDLGAHLDLTLSRLGGRRLSKDDRAALLAYVAWMKPPPVKIADATDPLVREGRRIFESTEAQCGMCHGGAGQSPDGMRHNVLSWAQGDRTGVLDTPSLRFVAGTAPYFHDGRYTSLRALLTHTRGAMGQEKKLSDHELDALEAYVSTL